MWFGTSSHGVGAVEGGIGRLIAKQASEKDDLHKQTVTSILLGVDHHLWIATYGAGLFDLDPATGAWRQLHHDQSDPSSLVDDECTSLLRDRSGMLWIGTDQGVSRMDPTINAMQTVLAAIDNESRLIEPNALNLLVDSRDNIWVGYQRQGVDIFDAKGRRIKALRPDTGNPSALPQRSITAFAESQNGRVWIGTRVGLFSADLDANNLKAIPLPINDGRPYVQTLMVEGRMLWVGTDSGLFRYDTENGTWRAYMAADVKGLSDQRVTALAVRSDHRLWVGTMRGLNLLDPDSGVATRIGGAKEALRSAYLIDLTFDRHGRLWIATGGDGIFVLASEDGDNPQFTHIGVAEGLPNMNIDALQRDLEGKIWASTDNGLAVIDPESMKAQAFMRADGVQFRNYWNHSAALTAEGDVLFGGLGGISVVHPHLVTPRHFAPAVVVSAVRVGTRSIPALRFNADSNGDSPTVAPIVVNPDDRAFQVEFAALDYSAPNRNRYAYKLEGYDLDWIQADASKRIASYTNMAPGDYRLLIRGSNRDGIWTQRGVSVPFLVLPAWYQTWTFRIVLVLGAILCIVQLVQVRTAYLRKAQLALEEMVAKRTEELRQSKLQLEEIAFLDALTGLPNRRLFAERFENFRALAERNRASFALLLIDLDKFKNVNDTYGHDAGDAVLIATTERLKLATRAVDFVGRLGGDEFAVLLDYFEPENAIPVVCERIIRMFAEPIVFGDLKLAISASIGVAIFGRHGVTQPELYKAADLALYEAKNRGRNRWFSSQAMTATK
jgi:diguanylate cyclase (GGDEF)-like protein